MIQLTLRWLNDTVNLTLVEWYS